MKLVAIVGADGTGKSTQAEKLAERLTELGRAATCVRPVFLLFDPWRLRGKRGTTPALSPRLRRVGNGSASRRRGSIAASAAGYTYALATYLYMRTHFRGVEFVVCDRYFYQYFFDISGAGATGIAKSFPRPSVVFWLDGDLGIVRQRSDTPPTTPAEEKYFEDAFAFYRDLAPSLGFVRIDASRPVEAVAEEIFRVLFERVGA
ncbi:MAG: hypothetical protein A3K68_04370 [Euryarchaeota archaeon RBG_16_68_13]|nr:MAG: hypothetical protein A3K68_04370 [Euryarchaeota archaeon RBG_16_68_13]